MNERERLIEILKKPIYVLEGVDVTVAVADYLLDNGILVPPCKVNDIVYKCVIYKDGDGVDGFIVESKVVGFHLGDSPKNRGSKRHEYIIVHNKSTNTISHINLNEIGERVFLTREEAEKALKERSVSK